MWYNAHMIEKAKLEDLDKIFEISCQLFDWKKSQLEECLKDENTIFLLKKQEKQVFGFLIAQNLVDSFNILLIATKTDCQKTGIGTRLLKELEDVAKKQKIEKIWLEVKNTNSNAIKFYEKQNFKLIATRKKYYKTGEDALIYEKSTN